MLSEKCDRQCDRQMEVDDRPAWSRCASSWTCSLALAGALSLSTVTTGALAQEAPNSTTMRSPEPGELPLLEPLCIPRSDDGHVSAIYLDLDVQLPAGPGSLIEQSATRVRRQQWFDASSDQSDVVCPLNPVELTLILESLSRAGCEIELPTLDPRLDPTVSPSADAGFSIDLISQDPSTLTVILEFAAGEIWEIGLATLDGGPLEPTAFASDGAGFFINLIEWGEDGELVALDADFEVAFADGNSVGGRILWNTPWTPDEEPFVPLSDDDWANAWPGEVSIEGPDLRLLADTGWVEEWLDSAPTEGLVRVCSIGDRGSLIDWYSEDFGFWVSKKGNRQQVDSIRYSRELAIDPEAAREAVAQDVGSLSQGSQSGATARRSQAIEDPTSTGLGVTSIAWWKPPTPLNPPSDSESSRDHQTGEIAFAISPAGLEESEQMEAHFEREETEWTAQARSVAVARNLNPEGSPDDTTGTGSASEIGPAPVLLVPDAVEVGRPVDDSSSLGSRIEEWWRAVRAIAEHWLRAIKAFMMETHP